MSELDINRLNVGTAIIERTRRTLGVAAARALWPMLGLPDLGGAAETGVATQGAIAFDFEGKAVRAVTIDGMTWFVGKDVAERLGYTNPTKAMNDHCRGVTKRYPLLTAGGTQEVRVLSEPDVLRLIVASKLPAAQRFERWIFEVVLPEIRRTGAFRPGTDAASAHELDVKGVVKHHPLTSSRSVSPVKAAVDARFLLVIEQFVRECCVVSADHEIQAHPLFLAYDSWELQRGKRPMSQTRFGRIMRLAGYKKDKMGAIYYCGLRLRDGRGLLAR